MAPATRVVVEVEPSAGALVRVAGPLGAASVDVLRLVLRRASEVAGAVVRVDLAACGHVHRAVRGCLADEADRLRAGGGDLVLLGLEGLPDDDGAHPADDDVPVVVDLAGVLGGEEDAPRAAAGTWWTTLPADDLRRQVEATLRWRVETSDGAEHHAAGRSLLALLHALERREADGAPS